MTTDQIISQREKRGYIKQEYNKYKIIKVDVINLDEFDGLFISCLSEFREEYISFEDIQTIINKSQ